MSVGLLFSYCPLNNGSVPWAGRRANQEKSLFPQIKQQVQLRRKPAPQALNCAFRMAICMRQFSLYEHCITNKILDFFVGGGARSAKISLSQSRGGDILNTETTERCLCDFCDKDHLLD